MSVGHKIHVNWEYWPAPDQQGEVSVQGYPISARTTVDTLAEAIEKTFNLKARYGDDLLYVDFRTRVFSKLGG